MKKTNQRIASVLTCILIVSVGIARGQTPASQSAAGGGENPLTNLLEQARLRFAA